EDRRRDHEDDPGPPNPCPPASHVDLLFPFGRVSIDARGVRLYAWTSVNPKRPTPARGRAWGTLRPTCDDLPRQAPHPPRPSGSSVMTVSITDPTSPAVPRRAWGTS